MERARSPIRTLDDAARYLDSLIDRERLPDARRRRLSLAPIHALLDDVGNPERALSIVHVAGSKGKGSTCTFGDALSRALGERTALFTSPHLERWTERFRIDGAEVEGERLAAAVERLRPSVERLRADRTRETPSFFDATTAAALLLFAQARVDRVWLEVGLGGRLDSTNAVAPAACCITSIELEHTQVLGSTLDAIAREKAGILKPGVPAVVARLAPPAARAVRARAAEVGAALVEEGDAFELATAPRGRAVHLAYRDDGLDLELEVPVLAAELARAAGLAVACVRALRAHAPDEVARAARAAFAQVALPGRIEVRDGPPLVVLDSAHTGASARALAGALDAIGLRDAELVLSVSEGKALAAIVDALARFAGRVWCTRADRDRSLAPEAVADVVRSVRGDVAIACDEDPANAVRCAHAEAARGGRAVVVAGSVYLAGVARRALREHGASR
ncbi:MAG: bifunctional folylpolyglutamate synthase/dihydrofolate synthase [Myxococcota bacterium]